MWNVLKWVLAALAAGFIGQFGRSLALRIIKRRRRRTATQEGTHPSAHDVAIEKEQGRKLKIEEKSEKKRAKQELKSKKKHSG